MRIARPSDVPAVGLVQATVWRDAYAAVLSPEVLERFEGPAFARVWRASLATPPSPRHELLVACAGDQVVGFAAVGPSADADADDAQGELLALGVHPAGTPGRARLAAAQRRRRHPARAAVRPADRLGAAPATRRPARSSVASGLSPDGAYRDRVVDADGTVVREVRLVADLAAGVTGAALPGPVPPSASGLAADRRRAVLRQSLSVGVATGAYGISFGALSVAAGLSLWQTMALSLLLFSGGSQFALVGIVAAGGSGVAAVATSSLLGVRNGLYGLQVSRLLGVRGRRRAAAAQLTIDESTAVAVAQPERAASRLGFWATGLAVFALWNLMTLVGALIGDLLGDPQRYGLDAAAAAAFCALLWPRLRNGETRAVAGAAALAALLVAPHAPAGVPVLVAALAAVVAGLRRPRAPEAAR